MRKQQKGHFSLINKMHTLAKEEKMLDVWKNGKAQKLPFETEHCNFQIFARNFLDTNIG